MVISSTDIMEITFNIIYLLFIWAIVVKMFLNRSQVNEKNKSIAYLILIGFFLLALGDTGHVGFRIIAFALGGLEENANLVGIGALCTAVTITFLYMLILEMWRIEFKKPRSLIYYMLHAFGVVRLIIFFFPQNQWGNVVPPFGWSLARNIPLMIQGIGVAVLILIDARKENKKTFKQFAYCIFISYAFYTPVILFVQIIPMIGMLMIPKTLAYMAMAWLGLKNYFISKH